MEIGTGLNTAQGGSPQGQTGVSPRGILNMTRINLGGRDQSLSLKSHVGFLEKQASLNFDQPHWFDLTNWRLTLTALYDNTRDVNTFSSSREEGAVQLTQRVTKATQLLYRFSFRRITVDPTSFPAGFTPSLIPLYSQPVLVGMPSLIFLRDTRDDPVNSTKGTYTTVDIGAGLERLRLAGGFWAGAGAECELLQVFPGLGACALDTGRDRRVRMAA